MNQSPAAAKCRNELLGDKGWDTMQNTTLQPKLALRPKKAAQIYHWVAFFVWSILAKAKSQRTYAWLEARKGKFMVQNRFQKTLSKTQQLETRNTCSNCVRVVSEHRSDVSNAFIFRTSEADAKHCQSAWFHKYKNAFFSKTSLMPGFSSQPKCGQSDKTLPHAVAGNLAGTSPNSGMDTT